MNLFGPPAIQIVFGLLWGWVGFIISFILFFVFFISWKYISKSDGKLSFKNISGKLIKIEYNKNIKI